MPDKKYLIEIPGMPEGSGVWDADKWERNKDLFMEDYPEANVFELGEYDADDAQETDQIMLDLGNEDMSGVWDNAKWERNKDLLMEDYPEAKVNRVRYVDYWGQKAEENRAKKAELQQPNEERNTKLAELGYYDDITGGQVDFDLNAPSVIGLRPLSSAISTNSVSGETEYLDSRVQEFFANDSAETDRQAEIARLDAEYDANPSVIAQREWEAKVLAERKAYASNLEKQIKSDMESDVDMVKAARGGTAKHGYGSDLASDQMSYLLDKIAGDEAGSGSAENEKLENYNTALKFLEKAKIARDVAGKGFGGAVGDWAKEGIMDLATQDDVEAYNEIGNILTRLEKQLGNIKSENLTEEVFDKYLTKNEQALIKAFYEYNSAMAEAQQDMSRAYKGGKIFAESVPFMLEFLATGGIYKGAGRAATSWMGKAFAKWIAKSAAKTTARAAKVATSKIVSGVVKAGVGTLARTAAAPGTYERMAEASINIDDDGHLNRAKESAVAFADMYVENLSEISGGLIGKGLGLLGKGVSVVGKNAGKLIAKTPLSKVGTMLADNAFMQGLSKFGNGVKAFMPKLEALGFHGLPEEVGEEFIGNTIRDIAGIQPGALKEMVSDDNFGAMLIGFAPMTMLGVAGGIYNLGVVNAKAAQLGKDLREKLGSAYTEEELDHMMSVIQNAQTAEDIQKALKPIAMAAVNSFEKGMVSKEQMTEQVEMLYQYGGFMAQNNALLFGKKAQDRQMMDAKREEFTNQYGRFWQEDQNETVQIATLNNGSTVFVVSTPAEDGKITTIDVTTGKKGFANVSDIATQEVEGEQIQSTNSMTMDAFLNGQIATQRKTAEETRMNNERNAQIEALRAQITPGTRINLGTEGSPVIVYAKGTNKNGVVIVDETGMESLLGWEQAAYALGQPIKVETDQQKLDAEISGRLQRMAERRMQRAITPATQATAEAAEGAAEVVAQEQQNIPLNEDGTVNEALFWTQDPEGYVKWNDEQNQDGGQDSLRQIAISKQELFGMLNEAATGQNTSNPTMRKAAEKQVAAIAEKIARLEALEMSYADALAEEQESIKQTAATPTATMSEEQLEQMDAQYQGILGKTRIQSERVRVMQEYLNKLAENSAPIRVLTKDNFEDVMRAEGCPEEDIKRVGKALNRKRGGQVAGFASNGVTFVMANTIADINSARITYVHERQHLLNSQNPEVVKQFAAALGDKENALRILEKFVGENGLEEYKNDSIVKLADEIICRSMEIVYSTENYSVDLQNQGLSEEAINIINTIDNGQRTDKSLASARRSSYVNGSGRENIEENGRNSEQVSGGILGEQEAGSLGSSGRGNGLRGSGEGAEVTPEGPSFRIVEDPEEVNPAFVEAISTDVDEAEYAQFLDDKAFADPQPVDGIQPDDVRFSIVLEDKMRGNTQAYFDKHYNGGTLGKKDQKLVPLNVTHFTQVLLDAANAQIEEMRKYMLPYLDMESKGKRFLPAEVYGKSTLFDNSSYGKTMENTLICTRTLAYIDFVEEVKKRIGRPLTATESFLASQMLYDIAIDPQCLYCYVSLDRKAYDEFLLRYIQQRDEVISKWNASDKSAEAKDALYKEFLAGRKPTSQMQARFESWLLLSEGDNAITPADLATKARRGDLKISEAPEAWEKARNKYQRLKGDKKLAYAASEEYQTALWNYLASPLGQVTDAEAYAQSASWAKKEEDYRSYTGELLKCTADALKGLMGHYGLRFYSFSEYSPAFILENMQMVRDAAARGLKGFAYTKEIDFIKIFAPTGMNINCSVYGRVDSEGNVVPDIKQGADWAQVQALREQYPNVGAVFVATNDEMVEWALNQPWIDVIIPFHIVRTGADIAKFYEWTNYSSMQADTAPSGKTTYIFPHEHHNDKTTFLKIAQERGLSPRFADVKLADGRSIVEHPNYMRLVNETRRSVDETPILTPTFNVDAAKESFDAFVAKGGYYSGYFYEDEAFEQGIETVVEDIKAGKTAKDVDYGRQDVPIDVAKIMAKRAEMERKHGKSGVIDLVEEAKKAVDNTSDIRFSIIGEMGATRDRSDEGLARLNNLEVARQMESQLNPDWSAKNDENALKIKVATGWERGADGKWRYEVDDVTIKPAKDWLLSKKKLTLRDIVEPNPVFDIYPELLDIAVVKDKSKYNLGAWYAESTKQMKLPVGALKDDYTAMMDYYGEEQKDGNFARYWKIMEEDFLHEIQHAIQHREGFARGGNPDMLLPEDMDAYNKLYDEMSDLIDTYNSIPTRDRNMAYAISARNQAQRAKDGVTSFLRKHKLGEERYKRLAGEVESNNVVKRSKLSDYERYNSLLASTEDVARKDQIFLMNAVESAESSLRFRITPEMKEIKKQAEKDGTFMKAPNGQPTNLSEEQWLMVRTKNFIKWFGDWLKPQRIEKLRNSEDASINGDEIAPAESLDKKAALEYGKKLQGFYTNKDTGASIQLQRGRKNGGVNEVLQHNYKDAEHLQSIAAIPQIIEKSIFIESAPNADLEKNPDVVEYQHFVCGLKIGGEDYTVHSLVAVDKKGDRYYDHNLTAIEKKKLLDLIESQAVEGEDFGTTPGTQPTILSTYKGKQLVSLLQVDASKVVDENGEPKVVYHQTNQKIYVNRETGENWDELGWKEKMEWDERDDWEDYWEEQDFNTFSRVNARTTNEFDGFFFAPEYDENHEYGDRTIAAFVNIKNPASREDYNIDSRYNDAGRNERIRLQEAGFDGVIRMDGDNVDEYIAFEPNQIKSATDNNGDFNPNNNDIRFRVTAEQDKAYMDAVKAGDMETAQRMVDEAAKLAMPNTKVVDENGNPKVVYHGTGSKFYTFRETSDSNELGAGYYFSDSYEMAERYATDETLADNRFRAEALAFDIFTDEMGHSEEDYDDNEFIDDYNESYTQAVERLFGNGHVKSVFLNLENPRIMSRNSESFDPTYRYGYNHYNEGAMAKRFNDGIIDEMFEERHEGLTGTQYVAFNPSQIKSADPVTYDNNGNVIPLSERFNPENEDIRFRVRGENESAEEFIATEIPRFQGSYNVNAPIILMDYSSKESAARSLGIDVKDMPDYMYDNIKELAKENGGAYVKELNTILIFAQDYITTSGKADNVFFHEGTHSFITENPHWLTLGEWLLDNAASGTKKKIADVVRMAYEEDEYVEEMLTSYTGLMLSLGRSQAVMNSLPTEMKPIWEEILNKFNYIPEYEDTRRKSERAGDEDARRDAGVPMRNTDGEKAVRKGKISWKQPAGLTSKERRVINEYFPGAFRVVDSNGNTLTPAQEEFFANSKAVDKDGNLLVLYHGTPRAGFTEFESGWFTTSKEDAISYSGDRKGRMFDPNEKYEPETLVAGDFPLGYMTFDSEEDRAAFLAEHPEAESAISEAEFDSMALQADEEYDDLIERKPELQKIWNAYREYERERFVDTTIGDIISNPEAYTEEDLMRAMLAYDSNASLDSLDDMDAAERKDALVSALQNANEETEGGILDMVVPTRVPRNGEGVKHNDLGNRTYEVYANVENPYEIDANGRGSEFESGDIYKSVEEALADEQYDGVIIRNWRVGRTQQLGDVVVPKNGSQIKLTINENPTELDDIRFSIRTKPAPKKTGKGYKVFYLKDSKLYPPMVANLGGVDTPVGVWLDAEEGTRAGVSKTGRPQVKQGGKGTQGGSGTLAYRPGWHLGEIPYAIQFNRKDENGDRTLFPADFVWAEVEYANDVDYQEEAMSYGMNANGKFQHSLAGLPKLPTDGSYRYRTNPNPETDPWIITGAMKVNRLLTPSEVDQMVIDAGREPQKRQEGAVTDAQIEELNKELGLVEEEEEVSIRTTGTPTEDIVAEGVSLSPAQLASLAGDIFAALPEESRKKITDGLNGNILGLQDAILQIPTSLATKEDWNDEDAKLANAVRTVMQDAIDKKSATSRPLTTKEALWVLYDSTHTVTDLVDAASRAFVAHNLGFDQASMQRKQEVDDYIRFRTASNGAIDAATDMYNYETSLWTERLKESWLDMNQSVISLQKAMAEASGMPIEPWENLEFALNRLSSKSYADKKKYLRDFLMPMWDAIIEIVKVDKKSIEEIERYMMLKHGLERNKKFAARDAKEFYRSMYDLVAERMKNQSHAQQVVALSEAKKALADIDAKIAVASSSQLPRLNEARARVLYDVQVADLVLRGDEKLNEQELQDYYDNIDNELDRKYWEFREKDYGGLTSMFVDSTPVQRSKYKSEEAYQQALLAATTPKFDKVADMEAEAQAEVDYFEKVVGAQNLWDKVNAATKETLRHQYEAGMITIEQYEAVRDMFDYYVPLRGFADNTAEDMYSYYMNNSAGGFTKPILGAKGRKTKAESPLGWIGTMAESAIQSDNKNQAKMCLYYMTLRRPDQNLLTITETWYEYTGQKDANGKKIFKAAYPPATDRALNADELRQHMEDWEDDMKKKQSRGEAYKGSQRVDLKGSVIFQDEKEEKEHVVRVKVAGKDYSILINGNPRAAQAINGLLNPDSNVGPVAQWIGDARRNLSALLTSYSPLFWVANYQRDLLSSTMRVSEADGWDTAMKYLANRRKAWRVASYIYKYDAGTLGDSYYEKLYKEFAENGGITGYTSLTTNKEYENLLEKYANNVDKHVLNAVKGVWDKFMGFGEAIEQVSRFAAFITAREEGKSIEEAINAAKEVSVNFNRKGSAKPISLEELDKLRTKNGKKLNKAQRIAALTLSAMPGPMKYCYYFVNASIQALSSSAKLAKKSPSKASTWVGMYMGTSIALAMLNYLLSDDDDDEYLNLPDYLRHSTALVKIADGYYFKWSIPQEMRPFYAWADILVRKMMGKMPHKSGAEVGKEMALAASQWLPVNPFEAEDPLLSLVPDFGSPFAEVVANTNAFGGKIYDDMSFKSEGVVKEIPAYRKATEKTGAVYVDIAEFLNDVSGGDEVTKGLININPAIVEHLIEGYGGGIYDFAKMMVSIPSMILSDDPVQIKEIPFVNKVILSVDETNMYSHTNEAFRHYKDIADNAKRVEKEYRESDDPSRADAYREEEDWRIYLLYKQYEKDFKDVKERLDNAVDKEEEDLLKQEQNVLREMFLDDIAKGDIPEITFQIREDVKRIDKEVKAIMKPVTEANKERLERKRAGDVDGMIEAIERRDSLKDTPEYRRAEELNEGLKKIKQQLKELGSVTRGVQRDSVIGELQRNYESLVQKMEQL